MPDIHAKLSASGSHRWINCPGSVALESNFPESTSVYAEQGTIAHLLAETKLRTKYDDLFTDNEKAENIKRIKSSGFLDDEMEEVIPNYVANICEIYETEKTMNNDAAILFEQRLDFSAYVPDGFGTGDVLMLSGDTLTVIDLKYGKGVKVEAENNPQLRLYALGALDCYGMIYDIKQVKTIVFQPRLDHISQETLPVEDLITWGEEVIKPAAALALSEDAPLASGDHCKFCKARNTCRKRAEEALEIARFNLTDSKLLTNDEIAEALRIIEKYEKWIKDIKEYALAQALSGEHFPGWKVVEGRANRTYADEIKAIETLKEAGFDESVTTTRKILTITEMEKLVGKKKFSDILGCLVVKPDGKPALVDESDKRPAINKIDEARKHFD